MCAAQSPTVGGMETVSATPRRAAHVVVTSGAELSRICDSATNLVVWPRPTPPWIQQLAGRTLAPLESRSCLTHPAAPLTSLVDPLRDALGIEEARALTDDVRLLAATLFAATRASHVDACLSVSTDDGCRKFHVDRRHARLLCTYVGPGTEWVANAAVRRDALCSDTDDVARANDIVVRDWRKVRSVARGWVAVLKGELWPGNDGNGLVHRSPPISSLGLTRLVLALDAHV